VGPAEASSDIVLLSLLVVLQATPTVRAQCGSAQSDRVSSGRKDLVTDRLSKLEQEPAYVSLHYHCAETEGRIKGGTIR
jgi:hypothetical protein